MKREITRETCLGDTAIDLLFAFPGDIFTLPYDADVPIQTLAKRGIRISVSKCKALDIQYVYRH